MASRHTIALLALAALAASVHPPAAEASEGFVVVVNQTNPADHLSRGELSKLFLKRAAAWPNGKAAIPCDLSGTNPVRKTFSQAVHGKPLWVVVAFWQQEIASGRSQPPAVCPTEQAALDAVRRDAGAVAYVADGTELGAGVKALTIEP